MSQFARLFGEIYPHIRNDIFKLCRVLNFEPTWQQEQLLGAVQRGDRRVAVRSGQGPGKTKTAGVVALWRTLQAEDAQTIVTAPTMRQVKEAWLAEFRRTLKTADPIIQRAISVTQTRVEFFDNKDWGIKTVTANKEENAQGYHEKNQSIIGEESSGIMRPIIEQFKGTSSNPNSLLLLIGNPNSRDCAFFDCFNSQAKYWTKIHWNAEQTPRSEYFDPIRNWEVEQEFGRDSDVYRVRVQGEFPHTDPNCVFTEEILLLCMSRDRMLEASNQLTHGKHVKQFGIDIARYGGDENTIYQRSGNAIVDYKVLPHVEPADAADVAFEMQRKWSWKDNDCYYVTDAGGIGQGVLAYYYRNHKRVLEFHNNGTAVDSTHYANLMTEAWFTFRKKLLAGEPVYIPHDQQLLRQLTTRRYYTTKDSRLILENKDEYMKRGYDSPDRADGLMMAMYDNVVARGQITAARQSKQRVGSSVTSRIGLSNALS